jgi:hypothetical protein
MVFVSGFDGEDAAVHEFDLMAQAVALFGHS